MLGMIAHSFNSSTVEVEKDKSIPLYVQGQPGLQSKFQVSQYYIVRPCIKKVFSQANEMEQQQEKHWLPSLTLWTDTGTGTGTHRKGLLTLISLPSEN